MEAPENIWLSPNEYRSNEPSCFWSESQRTDYDIAYVHKDAFIKKACQFIKEHHHEFSFWNTEEYELEFSTQKFIEDFKNYMKGE